MNKDFKALDKEKAAAKLLGLRLLLQQLHGAK